jgi:hypothetical protein
VGIYKTENSTKSVTIDPKQFGKGRSVELPAAGTTVALGDRTNK